MLKKYVRNIVRKVRVGRRIKTNEKRKTIEEREAQIYVVQRSQLRLTEEVRVRSDSCVVYKQRNTHLHTSLFDR